MALEIREAKAQYVVIREDTLTVDLTDGRALSIPLGWYPRLLHGTVEERNNWHLIGRGERKTTASRRSLLVRQITARGHSDDPGSVL